MHTKTKHAIRDFARKEDSGFHKLAEVVFSSALSLFLTYLAETYFAPAKTEQHPILDIICLFIAGISLYCVLYIFIRKIYSIVSKKIEDIRYNIQLNSPNMSAQKNKELIDDFDHIAFDNLIVACELLEEIKNSNDLEARTFCFHEMLYYLKTAIGKAKEVTHPDRREQCLNIFGNVNGIDVFRLYNLYKIMDNIITKTKEILAKNNIEHTIQVYGDKLKEVLNFQIKEIEKDIETIADRCENAKNDLNPKS